MNFFKRKNKTNISFSEDELERKDDFLEKEILKILTIIKGEILILSFGEAENLSIANFAAFLALFSYVLNKNIKIQINASEKMKNAFQVFTISDKLKFELYK